MNRKFFIMALIRGIFGYFPCGLGVAVLLEAYSRYSLRGIFNWSYIFPYRGISALLHKTL